MQKTPIKAAKVIPVWLPSDQGKLLRWQLLKCRVLHDPSQGTLSSKHAGLCWRAHSDSIPGGDHTTSGQTHQSLKRNRMVTDSFTALYMPTAHVYANFYGRDWRRVIPIESSRGRSLSDQRKHLLKSVESHIACPQNLTVLYQHSTSPASPFVQKVDLALLLPLLLSQR